MVWWVLQCVHAQSASESAATVHEGGGHARTHARLSEEGG
jgi:hypothetical protein